MLNQRSHSKHTWLGHLKLLRRAWCVEVLHLYARLLERVNAMIWESDWAPFFARIDFYSICQVRTMTCLIANLILPNCICQTMGSQGLSDEEAGMTIPTILFVSDVTKINLVRAFTLLWWLLLYRAPFLMSCAVTRKSHLFQMRHVIGGSTFCPISNALICRVKGRASRANSSICIRAPASFVFTIPSTPASNTDISINCHFYRAIQNTSEQVINDCKQLFNSLKFH